MFSKIFGKKDGADKPFTLDPNDLWYIEGKAYDLNKFTKAHPGGADVLLELRGKDCTKEYNENHGGAEVPRKKLNRMEVKNCPAEALQARCKPTTTTAPAP